MLNRKRRRNEADLTIAKKYPKLLKDFDTLEKKEQKLLADQQSLETENNNLQSELRKLKQSISVEATCNQTENLEQEVIQLKNDVKSLELDRDYLMTLVDDNVDLKLFDDSNSFTPQVRECVMKLTSLNVATKHVSSVMETVLKLAKKTADMLTSRQTVDNIVCEKVVVGQKHIGFKFGEKKNICLYGDETRKKGKTYQTFLVSSEEKDVFLGVYETCITKLQLLHWTHSKKFSVIYPILVRI